jgi:hypothetical protein
MSGSGNGPKPKGDTHSIVSPSRIIEGLLANVIWLVIGICAIVLFSVLNFDYKKFSENPASLISLNSLLVALSLTLFVAAHFWQISRVRKNENDKISKNTGLIATQIHNEISPDNPYFPPALVGSKRITRLAVLCHGSSKWTKDEYLPQMKIAFRKIFEERAAKTCARKQQKSP